MSSDEKHLDDAPPPYEASTSSPPYHNSLTTEKSPGFTQADVKEKLVDFQNSLGALKETLGKSTNELTLSSCLSIVAISDWVNLCRELDGCAHQILRCVSSSDLDERKAVTMLEEVNSLVNRTLGDIIRSLKGDGVADILAEFTSSGSRWLMSCREIFNSRVTGTSPSKGKSRASIRSLVDLCPFRRSNSSAEGPHWDDDLADSILCDANASLIRGEYSDAVESARSASGVLQAWKGPATVKKSILYLHSRELECNALCHLGVYRRAYETGSMALESPWAKNDQDSELLRQQVIVLHNTASIAAVKLSRALEAVWHARSALDLCDGLRPDDGERLNLISQAFFTLRLAQLEGGLRVAPIGASLFDMEYYTGSLLMPSDSRPEPTIELTKRRAFALHVQSRCELRAGFVRQAFDRSEQLISLVSDDEVKKLGVLDGIRISIPDILLNHSHICTELSLWKDALRFVDESVDHLIQFRERNPDSYFFLQQLGNAYVQKASLRRRSPEDPSHIKEALEIAQLGVATLEKALDLAYRLQSEYMLTQAFLILAKLEVSKCARCVELYAVSYDSLIGTLDIIRDIQKRNVAFDRKPRFLSISRILPNPKCTLAEIYRDASEDAARLKRWEESIEAAQSCCVYHKTVAFENPVEVSKVGIRGAYLDASRILARRLYAGGWKWIHKACTVGLNAIEQEKFSQRGSRLHGKWYLVLIISDCIVYLSAASRWATAVDLSQELETLRTALESPMPSELCGELHPDFLSSLMQVVRHLADRHDQKAVQLCEACVTWAKVVAQYRSTEEDESHGHCRLYAQALRTQALCFCTFSMWDGCVQAEQASFDLYKQMDKAGSAAYDIQYLQELRQISETLCAAERPQTAAMLIGRGVEMARGLLKRSDGQGQIRVELALCYSVLSDALVGRKDYKRAISADERCLQLLQGVDIEQVDLPVQVDAADAESTSPVLPSPQLRKQSFHSLCSELAMPQELGLELTAAYSKYESALASLHVADKGPTCPPGTLEHSRILAALSPKSKKYGSEYMSKLEASVIAFSDARGYHKALKLCEDATNVLAHLERYSEAISVNDEAQKHLIDVLVLYPDVSGKLLECYRDVAWYYHKLAQNLQAYQASARALDRARSLFRANDAWRNREALGRSLCNTAGYMVILDERAEASVLYEESLSIFRPLIPLPMVHREETPAKCMLAALENLYRRGMFNEAVALGREALAISRSLYAKDPSGSISATLILVGMCQNDLERPDECISHLREALALSDQVADRGHPLLDFILTHGHATLGINLMAAGDRERGLIHCDEVLRYSYGKPNGSGSTQWRRMLLSNECLKQIASFLAEEIDLFYEASRFKVRAEELDKVGRDGDFVTTWTLWKD